MKPGQVTLTSFLFTTFLFASWSVFGQDTQFNPLSVLKKSYSEIIPDSAIKHKGFLTLDQVGGKLYLEVPQKWIAKDILFIANWGLYDQKRIRLEKLNDKIILRLSPAFVISEVTDSAYIAWTKSNGREKIPVMKVRNKISGLIEEKPSILAQIPIETISPDGDYVIDATQLFLQGYGLTVALGNNPDYSKTVIEKIAGRPGDLTVEIHEPKKNGTGTRQVVRQLVPLPEQKMKMRSFDARLGFAGVCETNKYVDIPFPEDNNINMLKWRMEKKDPAKKISEPVRPIIIYIPNSIDS
ncbi:MAG: DUF5117 domain-containing protein, partial [Chitinophagaceae bacterium]|nr:DUF5117 domain-containing protein [Chitinophagaceae bacterium]